MQNSYLMVFDKQTNNGIEDYCQQLGYVCELLSRNSKYKAISLSYVNYLVKPAIKHHQIRFLFNRDGMVVAYIVWATLAPDVEERVLERLDYNLHHSEWNEGDELWVLDLVAVEGHMKYVLAYLRDILFHDYDRVRYLRVKQGKRVAREITRRDKVSFFR